MKSQDVKLGDVIRDTISGFEGVAVAKTEWLNGCVRITIQPKKLHDGKPIDNHTFDVEQCELVVQEKARAATFSGGERQNVVRARDPK